MRTHSQQHKRLYKLKAWQDRRLSQFSHHPLCEWCMAKGVVTPATEAHHNEPHKGDWLKFISGPLTSLCKPCHDADAQQIERLGYSTTVGIDGFPVDASHPFRRQRQ